MNTSLHRRPFLTPIWLSASTAFAGALVIIIVAWVLFTADSTEIIVVSQAETVAGGGPDAPLSAAGEARAALLARMFGDGRGPGQIDGILVSASESSRLTAAPIAARLAIQPTVASETDPKDLARRARRLHPGGRILVVGQSASVPAVVTALSHARNIPAMDAAHYGTMYIVTVPRIGYSNVLRLDY